MRRILCILVLGAATCVGLLAVLPETSWAQIPCGPSVYCSMDTGECIEVPTSLPPVIDTPWGSDEWYAPPSGNCGTEECYWWFRCGCGPPKSWAVCPQ